MKNFILLCVFILSSFNVLSINLDSVRVEINRQGIKHPEIVLKQCILETGWLKSYVCRKYNNLFGFFYKGDYKKYNHWRESVADYKKWQDKMYDGKRNYYEFLDCLYVTKSGRCVRYAQAKRYTQTLRTIDIQYE